MLLPCAALKVWSNLMDRAYLYYAGFAAGLFYLLRDLIGGFITPNYNWPWGSNDDCDTAVVLAGMS